MKLRRNAKVDLLRGVPLFSGCSQKELGQISALADEIYQPDDTTLIATSGRTARAPRHVARRTARSPRFPSASPLSTSNPERAGEALPNEPSPVMGGDLASCPSKLRIYVGMTNLQPSPRPGFLKERQRF